MHRFDLLVVGRDDQRVWRVAETDLTMDRAEERLTHYEPLTETQPVVLAMARAGTFSVGEDYGATWHEEEE